MHAHSLTRGTISPEKLSQAFDTPGAASHVAQPHLLALVVLSVSARQSSEMQPWKDLLAVIEERKPYSYQCL